MMIPGINVPETPNKHGYAMWIFPFRDSANAECSACNEMHICKPSNYCPDCGALMVNAYEAKEHYEKLIMRDCE